MGKIVRDPVSAARDRYDLIIVGGGVYGIMLSLEASRRKLRSLLLEKDDFAGATSASSLRILHGGLRYLQALDLHRFRESVAERGWFFESFPKLVNLLPCLMPLYGDGLRKPSILRIVLRVNDYLSGNQHRRALGSTAFPKGRVIDTRNTTDIFPIVDTRKLVGGAIWFDGTIPDPHRLFIRVLRSACHLGATVLNYVEANELLKVDGKVAGLTGEDKETGTIHEFRAPTVINAAGPWSRDLSRRFDRDFSSLFKPSVAWNVLLDRQAVCEYALAVAPKAPRGQTYFLLPWNGRMMVGTGHSPCQSTTCPPSPTAQDMEHFIRDINSAIPALEISREDIVRVYAGFLPAAEEGGTKLTGREVIVDHGRNGGPLGLFSVSGVKLTTARLVAEKTLRRAFPAHPWRERAGHHPSDFADEEEPVGIYDYTWRPNGFETSWIKPLRQVISEESVVHLEDLILRRTSLGDNPDRAMEVAPTISSLFDWNSTRVQIEIERLRKNVSFGCETYG